MNIVLKKSVVSARIIGAPDYNRKVYLIKYSALVVGQYNMKYERDDMEEILKHSFRIMAIKTRERLELTQCQMAGLLFMSPSSYSDIETGRTGCGVLTAIRLLNMQDDPVAELKTINKQFDELYNGDLQPI